MKNLMLVLLLLLAAGNALTVNLQFRSEFFNIPNFGPPNTSINNPQFGRINATAALPRVIQFALKLAF